MPVLPSVPLDYLVILDLEATCDDPADPHRPEIVEFPWLVYDLPTQSVLDHKQIFITPRWNSNPNPPPDAVRALAPDVAFAPSLADALLQFDAYIYHSFVVPGKSFYLLTDGPWDLTYYLFFEAARKALVLAPHFRTYINLRTEFSTCYPAAPSPTDRNTIFAYLQIPEQNRASGLQECRALAAVVTRLLRDGHTFTNPQLISDYDWATLPARIPAVATPLAAAVPVGGIIRLRGLPWSCGQQDVEAFLSGIPIVPGGVHFVKTTAGKATGEAFVQLESLDDVTLALERHNHNLGKRYIEVFKSSPVDMANHLGKADARRHMHSSSSSSSSATRAAAALAAAASVDVPPINFSIFGGPSDHHHSKANSQQSHSVKPSLRNAPRQKDGTTPPSVPQTSSPSYVVRVSGLPKQTTADDLLPLFDGLEMSGAGIHVMTAAAGSVECTGDAFVEMGSETWAKKAVARSGATLSVCGGVATARQVVEIHRSSIAQLRAAKRGAGRKNGGGGGNGPEVWFYLRLLNVGSDVGTEQVRVQMERFSVRDEDVKFVKTNSGGTEGGPGMRVARVAFRTRENRDAALKVCEGGVVLGGGTVMAEDGGCDVRGVKNAGDDGCNCVVRMRGLPYTSTEGDIVEFFDGFDIAPGGIMRGKDRHGRASGEAWVTFVRPCDASRAVVKLDKAHMGSRYIELKF